MAEPFNTHSPTAPQPHSPTAPQPHSPTAPQPHSPRWLQASRCAVFWMTRTDGNEDAMDQTL